MPATSVCVDASIVVKLVAPEALRQEALDLWSGWTRDETRIVAPQLLAYEIAAALRRKVIGRVLPEEAARHALELALRLRISLLDPPELTLTAFDLATQLGRPNTYDSHYLALAKHLQCPLWTADERFYNAAARQITELRLLSASPR